MFRSPAQTTRRWCCCCTGSAYRAISGTTSCRHWRKRAISRWRQTSAAIRSDARPDPSDFDNYRIDQLIGDALDIVAAVGHGERRFHLVGHDWGGSLSWLIADRYPERLASLTMLSRPHPASFARAMKEDPEQPHRSRHHHELLDPGAGKRLLADNGKWVRDRLVRNGVPPAAIEKHLSVIGNPPAMEAALAWYRARGERQPIGPTKVPTLFIWGDADDTVGRAAAEGTGEFIAADYQFAALPGVGHYAADQVPRTGHRAAVGSSRQAPV